MSIFSHLHNFVARTICAPCKRGADRPAPDQGKNDHDQACNHPFRLVRRPFDQRHAFHRRPGLSQPLEPAGTQQGVQDMKNTIRKIFEAYLGSAGRYPYPLTWMI
jgi:hypothetical protein